MRLPVAFVPLLLYPAACAGGDGLDDDLVFGRREAWAVSPKEARAFHEQRPERPNIILVSVDTLRPDHLSAYGYPRPTSPNLELLAREGVRFDTVVAQASSTLSSHASMFTSRFVAHHGAMWMRSASLPGQAHTMAEVLRAEGYDTAGFHDGGQVEDELGLAQGFDTYELVHKEGFAATIARARRWLVGRSDPDRPFFLFLHTYHVHHPYRPKPESLALFDSDYDGPLPDWIEVDEHLRRINGQIQPVLEIDEEDLAHVERVYDAQIREVDEALGVMVAGLRAMGLYDDALIVFTSDHGEEFDEHGTVGWHGNTLHAEQLRVPLIVRYPRGALGGRVVDALVRSIDIAPTILDVAGIEPPAAFDGVTLLDRSRHDWRRFNVAVSQLDSSRRLIAVRTPRWKLIDGELYDLVADPGETTDLAAQRPGVVELMESVRDWALRGATRAVEGEKVELSDELLDRLRELGYVR